MCAITTCWRIYRHSRTGRKKFTSFPEDQSMLPDLSLMFIIQLMPPEVNLLLEPHSETTLNQMVHNQKQTILNLPLVIFSLLTSHFPLSIHKENVYSTVDIWKINTVKSGANRNVTFLLRLTFISHIESTK